MKNWKFIKTGNNKVGNEAIVIKDGDVWVVLYANETKSKEFETEAEARAFAKQVGNAKVCNGIEISGVAGKLPPESEISKTIYEELKKNNYDKDKTVLSLSIKYKGIPNARMYFEDAVEKVIKSYSNRTVNESIDKQEWSMFKGLTKDAEKEVGNSTGYEKSSDIAVKGRLALIKKWLKDGIGSPEKINEEIKRLEEELKNRGLPVGNEETPEERKFGKVMREFDRGELKSSSGETVTNPEQAKAIAYSESEKVKNDFLGDHIKILGIPDKPQEPAKPQNGLRRARNAMNKKVKNGEWRQNSCVLKYFDYSSDPIEPVVGFVEKYMNKMTGKYEYHAAKTRGVHGPIDGKMFKTEDEAKRYVQNSWKSVYSPHWVDLSSRQYYAAYTAAKHDLEEAISYLKKNVEKSEKQYKYIEEARLKKAQDDLARLEEYVKTGNKLTRARHAMNASFYTTKEANPRGEYKDTEIDVQKRNADFRLIDVSGKKNTIVWKSGKRETVSDNELEQLKRQHPNWMTDF